MSASTTPLFPGFGLPLNFDPCPPSGRREPNPPDPRGEGKVLFRTALDQKITSSRMGCSRMPMLTKRETAMLAFTNQITDKEDWEKKIYQESITNKWRAEVMEQNDDFTVTMFDYCLEELKYKAEIYGETGCINLFHGDVVKSDSAIPKDLQEALKVAVAPLENVPDQAKDWHPGSDGMVLDLVHPSLYPLVYGLSRIVTSEKLDLRTCLSMSGTGEIAPVPTEEEARFEYTRRHSSERVLAFSRKFQWLPCDVDISGDTPKIISYINNLHPQKHGDLYDILEGIIQRVIPLWNKTLTPLRKFDFGQRIVMDDVDYGDFEEVQEREGPQRDFDDSDFDEDVFYDREWQWISEHKRRFLVRPEPGTFYPPTPQDPIDLKKDYEHRGLQIIIKLANIHLTPEKPEYNGGSWHVEGKMNEHICASAIYYYDNENITPSRLAFRQASDIESASSQSYEQGDSIWLEEVYGIQNWSAAVQDVGSVETRSGRVITFPNILQHQVQPFKLQDPAKPGHRKILALFLIDPHIRVISTAHVPCQQKEWWVEPMVKNDGPLAKLPVELRSLIVNESKGFPLSLGEAKDLRKELMEEREKYEIVLDSHFNSVQISLCEH
ncbi:hypothetical protein P691DRAFT_812021 [Macrolepiota fuliginosa MF-IS2]|uniref:Uncharacterized protein n=1 Tax=Macrolepiota fuliginosa MF-IS2 TaxID=1400762 RepID=A0A9P6C342_9AGAR|nr:hypothetical protein P691DRAFT_812021 [Macrolepiota fuliginosa MF-IS2]